MPNEERGPQGEIVENLNQRFSEEMDERVETPERSQRSLPTSTIRSVPANTAEPTIQMTITQLRMFIAEAVAQPIPVGRQAKEAPSSGEKRKAVSFEQEEPADDIQEQEAERPSMRREDGGGTRRKKEKDKSEDSYVRTTPFTSEVLADDLPTSFRSFTLECDGTTDPWDHVCRFENTAQLHLLSDGVKCRVFATTLTGAAQQWFGQLLGGSVPAFGRLCSMLLHYFASSMKHQRSKITLFSIKQQAEESLRGYVKRFNTAMLEVPAVSEEIKVSAVSQGLREGNLFRSLALDQVTTFDQLLERAERYINLEEAQRIKKDEQGAQALDRRKEREDVRRPDSSSFKRDVFLERKVGPRFDQFASLTSAPSHILMTIERSPMLKWPSTYSQVPRKSHAAGGFCRFHNDYGHSTDECQHLRDEIEWLVRAKNLKESVRSNTPKAPPVPPRDTAQNKNKGSASQNTSTPPSGNFVNTVRERGEWDDGTHEAAFQRRRKIREGKRAACWREELLKEQERRYTPHIIFGAVDETESFPPSNRALMITAEVPGKGVARILIDTGSSIDIICTSCLRRLNVGCEVYPTETDVIGFSGDVLRSVGEVTLPVSLGIGRLPQWAR